MDRYEFLRRKRDSLLDAVQAAAIARSKAEEACAEAMLELDDWLESEEGDEYFKLDEEH